MTIYILLMFKSVKEYFKNRNPFHKKLVLSSLLSDTNEIVLDDLLFLISCFENNNSDFILKTPSHYITLYFELALTQ